MDSTELLDQYRLDVDDVEQPQLWSDDEILDYANDAQQMFCRLTGGLADASSDLTTVACTVGTDWMPYSPLILKIRTAYNSADGRPVTVLNYEDLQALGMRFDGRVGVPRALVIGMEENQMRVYPSPVEDATFRLVVDRMPLVSITATGQTLEIGEQHKNGLVLWMKARGYLKQDAETYDKGAAERFEAAFRTYCASAKQEKDRRGHKTRVVAYGGY